MQYVEYRNAACCTARQKLLRMETLISRRPEQCYRTINKSHKCCQILTGMGFFSSIKKDNKNSLYPVNILEKKCKYGNKVESRKCFHNWNVLHLRIYFLFFISRNAMKCHHQLNWKLEIYIKVKNDLVRVDFSNVQEQASWVCGCDSDTVYELEKDFKVGLASCGTQVPDSVLRKNVLSESENVRNFDKNVEQFISNDPAND